MHVQGNFGYCLVLLIIIFLSFLVLVTRRNSTPHCQQTQNSHWIVQVFLVSAPYNNCSASLAVAKSEGLRYKIALFSFGTAKYCNSIKFGFLQMCLPRCASCRLIYAQIIIADNLFQPVSIHHPFIFGWVLSKNKYFNLVMNKSEFSLLLNFCRRYCLPFLVFNKSYVSSAYTNVDK